MANIIDAICNLINIDKITLKNSTNIHNRVNALGDLLEDFVNDLFCDNLSEIDKQKKLIKQNQN